MLSKRGQKYAQSGLMASYSRKKTTAYDKDTNPRGEISFANAENFLMENEIVEFVNNNFKLDVAHCGYNEGPVGTKRLRQAMATHFTKHFSPHLPLKHDNITFTAGVTGLSEMLAFNLADDGEALLLGRPIYGSFYDDLMTKPKCQLVYASFGSADQFGVDAVKVYEDAFLQAKDDGITIRALLICNPHNPLGKCYTIDALKGLLKFCAKYKLHLISDEIYGLSVFPVDSQDVVPFTSVLSIDNAGLIDLDYIHVLYGMSKDFGVAGLRLGCIITHNQALTDGVRAIGRYNWPSELSCQVATTILEDQTFVANYTSTSRYLLSKHYKLAASILDDAGIDYVRNGNAGFYIWVNLGPFLSDRSWEAEAKLRAKITDAAVPLSSGAGYKADEPGWFRILFTVQEDALKEALRRIIEVAKSSTTQ